MSYDEMRRQVAIAQFHASTLFELSLLKKPDSLLGKRMDKALQTVAELERQFETKFKHSPTFLMEICVADGRVIRFHS